MVHNCDRAGTWFEGFQLHLQEAVFFPFLEMHKGGTSGGGMLGGLARPAAEPLRLLSYNSTVLSAQCSDMRASKAVTPST